MEGHAIAYEPFDLWTPSA